MPDPRTLLRRRPLVALIVLILLLVIGYGARALGGSDGSSSGSAKGVVALSALPEQAAQTVALIQHNGPFPYRQDGVVFNNAERHLPIEPSGYYHEYTVRTPGSTDRGARRIIRGQDGRYYYTADHYDSFVVVDVNR